MAEMREMDNLDISTVSVENRKKIGNTWYGAKYTKILIENLVQHKIELYCFPIGTCLYIMKKQSFLFEISLFKVFACSIIISYMKDRWHE